MTQSWKKLGRVYDPELGARHPKLLSHAANPLPVHLENDVYRVFFSGRDVNNRSSVGAVDIDVIQCKVVREHQHPFFEHGPLGSYYADGVSIGNCYVADGVRYMPFMGWQAVKGEHWRGDVGRLIVGHDLSLRLDGQAPFMAADAADPVSLSYPWVMGNENEGYRMWYGSTIAWDAGNGEMMHVIKQASSPDGHAWRKEGLAVPYALGVAQAFSRPTVVRRPWGEYQMWFSYRSGAGEKYRIGFARNNDGKAWELGLNEAGIDVSPEGWDSEMVEYPFVFEHRRNLYMLYNGNGYGKTGFGLAMLDEH